MSITLLQGLTALQVGTGVKAGYCGKLLVDAGADVIRDDPLAGPNGERRMAGVAHAKELLKRGTPATPLADPGGVA